MDKGYHPHRDVIKKDIHEHLHLETSFPWKNNLEQNIDLFQIKSLTLCIHDAFSEDPERITCLEAIQRMKSLEYLSIYRNPQSQNPEANGTCLFESLLSALLHAGIALKRLTIRHICPKDRDMAILSSYLTKTTSLDELKLYANLKARAMLSSYLTGTASLDELELCTDWEARYYNIKFLQTFFDAFHGVTSLKTLVLQNFMFLSNFTRLSLDMRQTTDDKQEKYDKEDDRSTNFRLCIEDVYTGCDSEDEDLHMDSEDEVDMGDVLYDSKKRLVELFALKDADYSFQNIRLTDNAFFTARWFFQSTGDAPPIALSTFICPLQISWLRCNGYDNGLFDLKDLLLCNRACNLTRIELKGGLSNAHKKELMNALESTNIKSFIFRGSGILISDIITLLTKTALEELVLCGSSPVNVQEFLQLVPHITTNTRLTSLELGNNIHFYKRSEVAGLCEIIEKNTTLKRLILSGGHNNRHRNDLRYKQFLGDLIHAAKRNSNMWLCDAVISGSVYFFDRRLVFFFYCFF